MNKFYDIDLPFGEFYEKKLAEILTSCKIEVKTEKNDWQKTNNIYIELFDRGNDSGLRITKADYWAHVLQDKGKVKLVLIFPTTVLKNIVKKTEHKFMTYGGDYKNTLGMLLPLNKLGDILNE